MLRFEFVQDGEFEDPQYYIYDDEDNEYVGFIYYNEGWLFNSSNTWGLSYGFLRDISDKLEYLEESTKQQRILGFL